MIHLQSNNVEDTSFVGKKVIAKTNLILQTEENHDSSTLRCPIVRGEKLLVSYHGRAKGRVKVSCFADYRTGWTSIYQADLRGDSWQQLVMKTLPPGNLYVDAQLPLKGSTSMIKTFTTS